MTKFEQDFYNKQLPELIKAINKLAEELKENNRIRKEEKNDTV